MEKEEVIAAVLSHTFPAEALKALFPEDKKDSAPVILPADDLFGMQIELLIVGIKHGADDQPENQ